MAHYKRGRPRTASSRGHDRWKSKKRGENWYWLSHWPRWWDICFHNRPRRRRERAAIVQVMQGYDPDGILWPLEKKPHIYYW